MFPVQRRIYPADLPSPADTIALLGLTAEHLVEAGYVHIGMDHFVLPLDELAVARRGGGLHRNFMRYTPNAATDLVRNAYAQNHRDVGAWSASIDAGHPPVLRRLALSDDDLLRAALIRSLVRTGEVQFHTLGDDLGVDACPLRKAAPPKLAPLAADGLVKQTGVRLRVTPRGRLLVRVVAECFDR